MTRHIKKRNYMDLADYHDIGHRFPARPTANEYHRRRDNHRRTETSCHSHMWTDSFILQFSGSPKMITTAYPNSTFTMITQKMPTAKV